MKKAWQANLIQSGSKRNVPSKEQRTRPNPK